METGVTNKTNKTLVLKLALSVKKSDFNNTAIRSLGRRNVRWFRKWPTDDDDAKKYLKRFLADPSDVSNRD